MMLVLGQNVLSQVRRKATPLGLVALLALAALWVLPSRAEAGDSDTESTVATAYWSRMALVAPSSADGDFTPAPVLQVSGNGRMMMAFNYLTGGVQNPYFSLYDRSARTWTAPQPIFQNSNDFRYVTFAFDGANQAHAVWRNGQDVFYAAENGWPFASKELPSNGELIVDPPAIALGPGNVIHVVWAQGNNTMRVFHAFSLDGGSNWTLSPALSAAGHDASLPSVAATADGSVHVVWEEWDNGSRIFYRKATPQASGFSWSGNIPVLSSTLTGAIRPTLVAEGNSLHLGFTNQISQYEQYAYYRRFSAGGTWGSLVNVNPLSPVSVNTSNPYYLKVSLAVCGGNAHVFYPGAVYGEVYERIWSATSANNWQGANSLTAPGARYIHPSVVCDNNVLAFGVERVSAQGSAHDVYWAGEEKRSLLPLVRSGGS